MIGKLLAALALSLVSVASTAVGVRLGNWWVHRGEPKVPPISLEEKVGGIEQRVQRLEDLVSMLLEVRQKGRR